MSQLFQDVNQLAANYMAAKGINIGTAYTMQDLETLNISTTSWPYEWLRIDGQIQLVSKPGPYTVSEVRYCTNLNGLDPILYVYAFPLKKDGTLAKKQVIIYQEYLG